MFTRTAKGPCLDVPPRDHRSERQDEIVTGNDGNATAWIEKKDAKATAIHFSAHREFGSRLKYQSSGDWNRRIQHIQRIIRISSPSYEVVEVCAPLAYTLSLSVHPLT
jgi:hypothetical protein